MTPWKGDTVATSNRSMTVDRTGARSFAFGTLRGALALRPERRSHPVVRVTDTSDETGGRPNHPRRGNTP